MSSVTVLNPRGMMGMFGRYKTEVRKYGRLMFGEVWRLEEVRDAGEGVKQYQIMALIDGVFVSRSSPLCLVDFVLFWDGFRLCADELRS